MESFESNRPSSEKKLEESLEQFQQASDAGDVMEAEAAALEALVQASEWAESLDAPDWRLTQIASSLEEQGDWSGAEAAYRQILTLPDADHPRPAAIDPQDYASTRMAAHKQLGLSAGGDPRRQVRSPPHAAPARFRGAGKTFLRRQESAASLPAARSPVI